MFFGTAFHKLWIFDFFTALTLYTLLVYFRSVEDRYKAICSSARTRSIIGFGISCFQKKPIKKTVDESSTEQSSCSTGNNHVDCSTPDTLTSRDVAVHSDVKHKQATAADDDDEGACLTHYPHRALAVNGVTEYIVQTFSITVLCSESYIVEPEALQFLVDHGFNFNKQCSVGVPYYRGNDKVFFLNYS